MGCTTMGNAHGSSSLTEEDMEFLREHTELTANDLALYENFLEKHPDGTISRADFRFDIIFKLSSLCRTITKFYNESILIFGYILGP